MKNALIAGGAAAGLLALLALVFVNRGAERGAGPAAATPPAGAVHPSFLYGRITTAGGDVYEGRLRFGAGEEAFWSDYFNGAKRENPWAAYVPPALRPKERRPVKIFGLEIAERERPVDLGRLFMARFGDLARIEAHGRNVRVTLKSGTAFDLDRFEASDFDDGVRVWDGRRGVADLDSLPIRAIEFLPTPRPGPVPARLHGTVRTRHGEFTGFLQWDREKGLGSDEIEGRTADGPVSLRFDAIRSIARHSRDSSAVELLDGREVVLSGTRQTGRDNRGIYVDVPRYGRVLVSWDAFERVQFSAGGAGPAYGDFPPGGPLTGRITTRDGRRLAGRLVFDLDESEVTETLDAPFQGVTYTIPFGLIASIALPASEAPGAQLASVTLHSGEQLRLESSGDLGPGNAGILVFLDGRQRPEYVAWSGVARIDLDRPAAMYP